ncbi:endonuclease/exonuclease/phosphatase family protein, partial [Pseudomonas syringae pv. tagetis]
RVIRDEQPAIVLLQGGYDGAKNSDYEDQLALIKDRVADLYPCSTLAFYWKALFVPNPHIWCSVGRKLASLCLFHID